MSINVIFSFKHKNEVNYGVSYKLINLMIN